MFYADIARATRITANTAEELAELTDYDDDALSEYESLINNLERHCQRAKSLAWFPPRNCEVDVKHWTNDERTEYSELLDGVLSEAETSRDRTALMVVRVDDAIQAHRAWAREIAAEARQRGHASQWKSHAKKARVLLVTQARYSANRASSE